MTKLLFLLAAFLAVLCGVPAEAQAWGPGVHLAVGDHILAHLHLLPALLADCIARHQRAFLYGALSPDIFIGKGSRAKPTHSHNWSTAQVLLATADTRRHRAHACGYITHLAADVVAHNHYVPNVLSAMPMAGRLPHVYLEAQADNLVSWDPVRARRLVDRPDAALDASILLATQKGLPLFLLRKRLFGNTLAFWDRDLDKLLRRADRALPLPGNGEYLHRMFDLTMSLALGVLLDPEGSPVTAHDPIGCANLRAVRRLPQAERRANGRSGPGSAFPVPADLLEHGLEVEARLAAAGAEAQAAPGAVV